MREYTMVQPLWKTVLQFLIRLKIHLPYDSEMSAMGMYPREMKTMFTQKPVQEQS